MPISRLTLSAVCVAVCVLVAGCAGFGGAPDPTSGQPPTQTASPNTTTDSTTNAPAPSLSIQNEVNATVDIHVTLSHVSNGTAFYNQTLTTSADSIYLTDVVADHNQYQVTVRVANASLSHSVFAGESYAVTVHNRSSVTGHENTR